MPAVLKEYASTPITQITVDRAVQRAVERSKEYTDRRYAESEQCRSARGWIFAAGVLALATIVNVMLSLLVVTHA